MTKQSNKVVVLLTRWTVGMGSILFALLVFWVLVMLRPVPATSDAQSSSLPIRVIETRSVTVQRQFTGYGVAQADNAADIPARISATVVEVPPEIRAGRAVKKGQLIVKLDDSDFARQVEIAEQLIAEGKAAVELLDIEKQRLQERLALDQEDVRLAEQDLERIRKLYDQGVGNPQGIDRARRAVIAAQKVELSAEENIQKIEPRRLQLVAKIAGLESSLDISKLSLKRSSIYSPMDGILQSVDIDVGENLAPGQRVARVVNLNLMEVGVQLPAAARAEIAVGDRVTLTATNRDAKWESKVLRIAPEDDATTRTVTVFVEVDQHEAAAKFGEYDLAKLLTPGMYLYGAVTSGHTQQGIIVPRRSIREGRVMLVKEGVIHSRPVTIAFSTQNRYPDFGIDDDQWAVLQDGSLAGGELLVINGSSSLLDGDMVTAVTALSGQVTDRVNGQEVSP